MFSCFLFQTEKQKIEHFPENPKFTLFFSEWKQRNGFSKIHLLLFSYMKERHLFLQTKIKALLVGKNKKELAFANQVLRLTRLKKGGKKLSLKVLVAKCYTFGTRFEISGLSYFAYYTYEMINLRWNNNTIFRQAFSSYLFMLLCFGDQF